MKQTLLQVWCLKRNFQQNVTKKKEEDVCKNGVIYSRAAADTVCEFYVLLIFMTFYWLFHFPFPLHTKIFVGVCLSRMSTKTHFVYSLRAEKKTINSYPVEIHRTHIYVYRKRDSRVGVKIAH